MNSTLRTFLLAIGLCVGIPSAQYVDTPSPLDSGSVVGAASDFQDETGKLPEPSALTAPALPSTKGVKDLSHLGRVAVLHEGRLKPMETFARHVMLQLSGKSRYEGRSALDMVAAMLFAPYSVRDAKLILINHPEAAQALGLEPVRRRLYAFSDLEGSFDKLQAQAEKASRVEDEKRDLVQNEILRVYSNTAFYFGLKNSIHFALPDTLYRIRLPETRTVLSLDPERDLFSFWELMMHAPHIAAVLEGVEEERPRSDLEEEVIGLSQAMFLSSQTVRPSSWKILPMVGGKENEWVSPGEAVAVPNQMQMFQTELQSLFEAGRAYREGNQPGFDAALQSLVSEVEKRAYDQMERTHFPLEILYQKTDPFYRSLSFYWLAMIGCFAFFLFQRRWIYLGSLWLLSLGLALNVIGMLMRMIIMERPPVTSLFETFPFVGACSVLTALLFERSSRRGIALLAGAIMGVIMLHVAMRYAAEGDTMKVLVAVLRSNFWLSTHVITINIGYAACALSSVIGHIWLLFALLPNRPGKGQGLKEIERMLYGSLGFGLLFAFFGTMLGGIWADQSWGRFWGWDPKENGALLIVLWVVILLHARMFGYVRSKGMALGAVILGPIVALAWFGVNLLNVGLHSYGFTEGASTKLFVYLGVEGGFALLTGIWLTLQPGKIRGLNPSGKVPPAPAKTGNE